MRTAGGPSRLAVAAEDFEFRGLRIAAGTFSMFAAAAHTEPRVFGAAGSTSAWSAPPSCHSVAHPLPSRGTAGPCEDAGEGRCRSW